ncbi:MAG: cell wall-binding repeat-containing protein [Firmicutes bacterium]|nr:cell wall-binding repeat-containing protein [Bacillota bacterium]
MRLRRPWVGLMAALLTAFGIGPGYPVAAQSTPMVHRLAGADRLATAIAIADAEYPNGPPTATVVLASSADANLIDSVTAAPLAYALKAPILLTQNSTTLGAETLQYLNSHGIETAYLIGADANPTLAAGLPVPNLVKVSGADRFATAAAIANALQGLEGGGDFSALYVASAQVNDLSDALAIAPWAARAGAPVLLAAPGQQQLPASEAVFVTNAASQTITVVGAAADYGLSFGGHTPTAIGSASLSPYANAVAIAQAVAPPAGYAQLALANAGEGGTHLVDAVAAGPWAAQQVAPILFTNGATVPASLSQALGKVGIVHELTVFGGPASIPDATVAAVVQTLSAAAAGSSPAGSSQTLNIPANQAWVPTGIQLQAGETVTMTASGTINDGSIYPQNALSGPGGLGMVSSDGYSCTSNVHNPQPTPYLVASVPCESLVAFIGSAPPSAPASPSPSVWEVGSSDTVTVTTGGELYLSVNDNYFPDNSGAFTVTISTSQGSNPSQASGLNLTLTANPNPAQIGQPVTVTATLSQPVSDGTVSISLEGTTLTCTPVAGSCSPNGQWATTSQGAQRIVAKWSGDAQYPPVQATAWLAVGGGSPPPYHVTLSAGILEQPTLPANGVAQIPLTVTVTGSDGTPQPYDQVVLSASCGSVSPSSTSLDAQGQAQVTYTACGTPGMAVVRATEEWTGASSKLALSLTPEPQWLCSSATCYWGYGWGQSQSATPFQTAITSLWNPYPCLGDCFGGTQYDLAHGLGVDGALVAGVSNQIVRNLLTASYVAPCLNGQGCTSQSRDDVLIRVHQDTVVVSNAAGVLSSVSASGTLADYRGPEPGASVQQQSLGWSVSVTCDAAFGESEGAQVAEDLAGDTSGQLSDASNIALAFLQNTLQSASQSAIGSAEAGWSDANQNLDNFVTSLVGASNYYTTNWTSELDVTPGTGITFMAGPQLDAATAGLGGAGALVISFVQAEVTATAVSPSALVPVQAASHRWPLGSLAWTAPAPIQEPRRFDRGGSWS